MALIGATGCDNNKKENQEMALRNKVDYASVMGFDFHISGLDEDLTESDLRTWLPVYLLIDTRLGLYNPDYTDLVFLHSEEESRHYPDNVITAWPSETTPHAIEAIHIILSRENEREPQIRGAGRRARARVLEDFGLSHPLTVKDLVDDWEKVMLLFDSFTTHERILIGSYGVE